MNSVKFLQIEPTTRCNFRCSFCYGRHLYQSDMPYEIYKSIINQLPDLHHIELQGEGEPFLHPQFFDMVQLASRRGIKVSTITNGSMFTPENIDLVLRSGFEAIKISIESPHYKEFEEIRGGDLNNIINGINNLLRERNNRNLKKPILGFAVTILKQTKHLLPEICKLYNELEMDGGIGIQPLNPFSFYTQYYNEHMLNQIITDEERLDVILERTKIDKTIRHASNDIKHYTDDILTLREVNRNNTSRRRESTSALSESLYFISCHNLDKSLFIDCNGFASGCCAIKDHQFSFGQFGKDTIKQIIEKRDNMCRNIRGGIIPTACLDCSLANSISSRLSQLLNLKPNKKRLLSANEISNAELADGTIVGEVFNDVSTYEMLFDLCDGQTTCLDIIRKVSDIKNIDLESAKILVLPALNELFRQQIME